MCLNLKKLEKDGYTFSDDGKIIEPETANETEESSESSSVEMIAVENGKTSDASVAETTTTTSSNQKDKSAKQSDKTSKQTAEKEGTATKKPNAMPIDIAVGLIIAATGMFVVKSKKNKQDSSTTDSSDDKEES